MKLLNRYLLARLSVMSLYALLSLLALYSFFDLVNEIGDAGEGNYTAGKVILYVLMQMPAHAYQLMPLAVLIGSLLALSQLAANSELAVIKTSGWSTAKIISVLLQFGVIFAIVTALLGEWLAPQMSRSADLMRVTAKTGQAAATRNGLWLRQENSMLNIAEMLPDNTLVGVKIWRYNAEFKLSEMLYAEKARVENGYWLLHQVKSSKLNGNEVQTAVVEQLTLAGAVGQNLLNVLLVKPEQMSLHSLGNYIQYLKDNQQQTRQYQMAWWQKLMYPIATIVMALVGLAFTPQQSRHSNMGLKLIGGICLGLLFHFSGQFFSFTSQLYHFPPVLAAMLPTVAFALWAVYLIRKQEQR